MYKFKNTTKALSIRMKVYKLMNKGSKIKFTNEELLKITLLCEI